MTQHQQLPRAGADREALRAKGQFWTPDWVAEAMVGYVLSDGAQHIFDPAVGAGAFLRAARSIEARLGRRVELLGTEVFGHALAEAESHGLSSGDLAHIQIRDFVCNPPDGPFSAIVANPPYIRHHRLPAELKSTLKAFSTRLIGRPLDGRAGLHVFFLLRALERLAPGGRLAFILPADSAEGVFAPTLWKWVAQRYRLDAVVTFDHEATPFPGVDTNALVILLANATPSPSLKWALCKERGSHFLEWTLSDLTSETDGLPVTTRKLDEALATGLSRAPTTIPAGGPVLGDFAKVVRGIATGANEFFFLTKQRAQELDIPPALLRNAIGRTRDVIGDSVSKDRLLELDADGRPTQLLSPDGRAIETFSRPVQEYLKQGEKEGLSARTLIATRRPWYKMESREPPAFLFAYLGRRNARFIRNLAGVVPLTGFLCVYPHDDNPENVEALWRVLSHPDTVANLALVGKSYGGGAIKVEPRALERLPLPRGVMAEVGLTSAEPEEQLLAL